jgi:hypothetical protein
MPNLLKGCKVERSTIERLKIIGPMERYRAVMDQLIQDGYRLIQSGGYSDHKMFPRYDDTRFLFIAERIIEE